MGLCKLFATDCFIDEREILLIAQPFAGVWMGVHPPLKFLSLFM